jgi:hypothetical protein
MCNIRVPHACDTPCAFVTVNLRQPVAGINREIAVFRDNANTVDICQDMRYCIGGVLAALQDCALLEIQTGDHSVFNLLLHLLNM